MNTTGPEIRQMFFVLYLFVGTVGLFGNYCVLNILRKYRRNSLFHIQLAIGNMIMMLSLVFSCPSALYGKWIFGDTLCEWFGFQVFLAGFLTSSFSCLICVESYLAVCYTKLYSKYSEKITQYSSIVVWCYSLVFALAPLFGWNRYGLDHRSCNCGIDITRNKGNNYSYVMTTHSVFVTMALVAVYCIVMMYRKKMDKPQPFLPLLNNIELRQASTIMFVSVGLSSLPFYLRTLYFLRGYPPLFNSFLTVEFSHWCIKLGSVLSCVAYITSSTSFKRRLIGVLFTTKNEDQHD